MKPLNLTEPDRYLGAQMVSASVEQLDQDAFFVSASPVMRKLRAQAELLAQVDVPVFITGERGSGKDAVAKLIHGLSVRSGFKFLKLNCAATPAAVLESELFGANNEPGAGRSQRGLETLGAGDHGTIYLEEIVGMPLELQARLLQTLQKRDLDSRNHEGGRPLGVRILAATSSNLEKALADQKLLEGLYYRLSAFTVGVPPLRQRKEDISLLLRYSMHRLARHYGLTSREFSPDLIDTCQSYPWPGNLSELEAFVKRYLVSGDDALTPSEPESVRCEDHPHAGASRTKGAPAESNGRESSGEEEKEIQSLKALIQGIKSEAEKNAIGAALDKTGWNRKAAARLLKVSYRTLLYKIEQYQMTASHPSFSASALTNGNFAIRLNGTKGDVR